MSDVTWGTESDWQNAQDSSNVAIVGSSFELADAIPDSEVDHFDDGDLDEWSGDPVYSITSSPTMSGSGALQLNANKYSPALQSSSGLPNYPSRGNEFWVYIRSTGTNYFRVDTKFFTQSSDKRPAGYVVELNGSSDEFRLGTCALDSQGVDVELAVDNVSPSANEWLKIEVESESNGTITARLIDSSETQLAEVTTSDSTYNTGGIAVEGDDADNGVDFYWDSWITE